VSIAVFLAWPGIVILPIYAYGIAEITDISHCTWPQKDFLMELKKCVRKRVVNPSLVCTYE
jgi:hypothetical protein